MSYLPKSTELDDEQNEVLYAPLDRPVLITGPPGSGKTVMGVHRSIFMRNDGKDIWVVAYNNTLASFTRKWLEEAHEEQGIEVPDHKYVSTFHSWFSSRFRTIFRHGYPYVGDQQYEIDWQEVLELFLNTSKDNSRKFFSHSLVVDEGQDLSKDFYKLLGYMHIKVNLLVTILADENQRLDRTQNSTIDQIRDTFNLFAREEQGERNEQYIEEYALKKNYRNTVEIAKVAALFYNGIQTGIPELPTKTGVKPKYRNFDGQNDCIERIAKYAHANPKMSIGVIISSMPGRQKRNEYFRALQVRGDIGSRVQVYRNRNDLENLDLHAAGRITVLHSKSMKGLEFDTVFAVDLEAVNIEGANLDDTKMELYVLCSRPREELFLCCSELNEGEFPDIFMREEFKKLRQGLLEFPDSEMDVKEGPEGTEEPKEEEVEQEVNRKILSVPEIEKTTSFFIGRADNLEEAIIQIIQKVVSSTQSNKFVCAQFEKIERLEKKTIQNIQAKTGGIYSPSPPKLEASIGSQQFELKVLPSNKKVSRDDVLIMTDMQNVKESDQGAVMEFLLKMPCDSLYMLFKGMSPQSSPIYKQLMEKISPKMLELK